MRMPASTRTLRWWETVGWESPTGAVRSQTRASWSSCAATEWRSSRSRAGSAIAFSAAGEGLRLAGVITSRTTGEQQSVR